MTPARTSRPRRAAIYARLSVTTEESVSIGRQLDAARRYCEARGWTVVVEAVDDGVSASKNRPEDRAGWRSLLESPEKFDAVVIWKVDRLARRVLDFLNADADLQVRGAGLVAVEDPIDMTTAQGRAFATMLAVFAEMEAAAISARVTAARQAIIKSGRRAGGRPPLGWMNVPNPDGPGVVLAKDPEWIGTVEELARRAMAGESLYGLVRWLEAEGKTPSERKARKNGHLWHEATVEAVLRNPVLAGMTPYTPGRKPLRRKTDADDTPGGRQAWAELRAAAFRVDVLRDAEGLPVVDESLAILTPAERRSLLATLDGAKQPGTRQKAGSEPALLYGLARCGTCGGLMYRAMAASKYRQYRCQQRDCTRQVGISRDGVEEFVAAEFLRKFGRFAVVEVEEVEGPDPAPRLAEVEAAIAETAARMTEQGADFIALGERMASLHEARLRVRAEETAAPPVVMHETGETFAEAWERHDVEGRRGLLMSGLAAVEVAPGGGRGRAFDPARVSLVWRQ